MGQGKGKKFPGLFQNLFVVQFVFWKSGAAQYHAYHIQVYYNRMKCYQIRNSTPQSINLIICSSAIITHPSLHKTFSYLFFFHYYKVFTIFSKFVCAGVFSYWRREPFSPPYLSFENLFVIVLIRCCSIGNPVP